MNKTPSDMITGTVFNSNKSGRFVIINYINGHNVEVEFIDTGYKFVTGSQAVRKGNVKDPMAKVSHGVACFGAGEHKASVGGKTTIAYNKWNNMLVRCYDEEYLANKPTYRGCSVCNDWLNFQNFADWFYYNYPDDGDIHCMDKDFKVIGNKVYSPETCMFVPNLINCFLTDNGASRGEYMIGVTYPKDSNKYKAYCSNPFTGGRGYIGYSETEQGAHMLWRKRKSEFASKLTTLDIGDHVKDGLNNYKEALDNFKIYKDGYSL
jgi:hypothetical protein